jgi:hypothetical protein
MLGNKNVTELADQFVKFWTDQPKHLTEEQVLEATTLRTIQESIQNIIDSEGVDDNLRKKNVISYCKTTFTDQEKNLLGTDFDTRIEKMFDNEFEKSTIRRGAEITTAAIVKLTLGVVGLAVGIAGDGLMFAGKALDVGTLGIVNNAFPILSMKVSPKLARKNYASNFKRNRLNQLQIAGTHLADLGKGLMKTKEIFPKDGNLAAKVTKEATIQKKKSAGPTIRYS